MVSGMLAAPRRVVEFSIEADELAQLEAIARSGSEAAIWVERARLHPCMVTTVQRTVCKMLGRHEG